MMRIVAILILAVLSVSGLRAETKAILIGVSDYDDGIGLADLRGPVNDVRLLAEVMAARGVSDVTLLADGVEGAARPTRAAILGAFQAMAGRTGPGDLVYIHLSGHGTRQADSGGDETDGLDEVFLPADTARAEPGAGTIPNAIVDDELGEAVRAIRMTGADVWVVVDSCHSGSALRAGSPGTATRYVDPLVLGVDVGQPRRDEPLTLTTDGPEPPGGYLAFYAARSTELARELAFEGDDGEVWYGLFTAKLAARLQGGQALSYRQLFQAVLTDMNDASVPGGARLQTPTWEGNLIDAAVFGGADTIGVRRFEVRGSRVLAGHLHGLEDGTVLGLVADAADPADALIGFAQMRRVKATKAFLTPVAADCVANSAEPCAGLDSLPEAARFAQVVARPVDRVVRLSEPRWLGRTDPLDGPERAALNDAIATAGGGLEIDPAAYDVEVVWDGAQFWFGPRAEVGGNATGLAVPPETGALAAALGRIHRAETFARLLGAAAGKASPLSPPPVDVSVALSAVSADMLEPPGSGVDPFEECEIAREESAGAEELIPPAADLKQCDFLTVAARGAVAGARDVNRVHIDAQYCVHARHEVIEDTRAMRQVGPGMIMCSDCPGGYSAGSERLFVIVTEAQENAEAMNLEGLVENCGAGDGLTRGTERAEVLGFLNGLARAPGTRGSFGAAARDVWVTRYDWTILPKPEVFARSGRKE